MKSNEMCCYRLVRVSVSREVSWLVQMQVSDAAVGSDAGCGRRFLMPPSVQMPHQMLRSVQILPESSKNSTYFPKQVLSKLKTQIQLNIFYISSHAGRFTKSSHTDRRYSTLNFFFSSIRI